MGKKLVFLGISLILILLISQFAFSASTTQVATAPVTKTKITTYFYAGSLVASKSTDEPGKTQYYIQDHLSSNMKVLEGSIVEQTNKYYAFGETTSTGVSDNNYKYTGKELDEETGLYYYGARYYKPEIGRFIQADALTGSIGSPLSMNRYAYTRNNPLKFIDPSGNADESFYETYGWSDEDKAADRAGRAAAGKIIATTIFDTADDLKTATTGSDLFGEDAGSIGRGIAIVAAIIPGMSGGAIIKAVKLLGGGAESNVYETVAGTAVKLSHGDSAGVDAARLYKELGGETPDILQYGKMSVELPGGEIRNLEFGLEMKKFEGDPMVLSIPGNSERVMYNMDALKRIAPDAFSNLGRDIDVLHRMGSAHGDLAARNMNVLPNGQLGIFDFKGGDTRGATFSLNARIDRADLSKVEKKVKSLLKSEIIELILFVVYN